MSQKLHLACLSPSSKSKEAGPSSGHPNIQLSVYAGPWGSCVCVREREGDSDSEKGHQVCPLTSRSQPLLEPGNSQHSLLAIRAVSFFFYVSNVSFIIFIFCFSISWPCCMACGILVPQQGMEPMPPVLAAWHLSHWATREVPAQFHSCLAVGPPEFQYERE